MNKLCETIREYKKEAKPMTFWVREWLIKLLVSCCYCNLVGCYPLVIGLK